MVDGVGGGVDEGPAEPLHVGDVELAVGDGHIVPRHPQVVLEPGPDEALPARDERSHGGSR